MAENEGDGILGVKQTTTTTRNTRRENRKWLKRRERWLVLIRIVLHAVYMLNIFNIHFKTPIVHGMDLFILISLPLLNASSSSSRMAIWLFSKGTTPLKMNKTTRTKISKFTESIWKLTYYGTVEFCILTIAYNEPWFTDIKEYFRDWPNQELKFTLELIYMCQCGFYAYSIAALLLWETRRKDFSVMMSHHVITVILISFSYFTRFFRIGAVVLALHDASDVFMEGAKLFKYSGKELGASICFGLFAISWFILRLIIFPFWTIRASSYHLCDVLKLSEVYDMSLYYIFNTMLLSLLIFHIYWWILICAMIMRQLKNRGQVGEDIRSDSEDDN